MSSPTKSQNHTLHIVSRDFFLAQLEWYSPKGTMSRDSIFVKNSIPCYCNGPVIISDIKKAGAHQTCKKVFFMQKNLERSSSFGFVFLLVPMRRNFIIFDPSRKDVHNSRHIECSLLCSAMLLLLILRSLLILLSSPMTTILVSTQLYVPVLLSHVSRAGQRNNVRWLLRPLGDMCVLCVSRLYEIAEDAGILSSEKWAWRERIGNTSARTQCVYLSTHNPTTQALWTSVQDICWMLLRLKHSLFFPFYSLLTGCVCVWTRISKYEIW